MPKASLSTYHSTECRLNDLLNVLKIVYNINVLKIVYNINVLKIVLYNIIILII
jgi:hypothetical protein